jgi:hypothetical protein
MPTNVIQMIETIAKSEALTKAEAIRQLIGRGVQAWVEEHR